MKVIFFHNNIYVNENDYELFVKELSKNNIECNTTLSMIDGIKVFKVNEDMFKSMLSVAKPYDPSKEHKCNEEPFEFNPIEIQRKMNLNLKFYDKPKE